MNILYYILLVAGGLFLISMLLICIGLFHTPKPKAEPEEYMPPVTGGSRRLAEPKDFDDDEEEYADADDEPDEEYSDTGDEPDEEQPEPDVDAEDEDASEPEPENDEEQAPIPEPSNGIEVEVTVIDNNKTYKVVVDDEVLIGRNPQCDVVVNKPMVSSVHCVLTRDGKKVMIEDNNSTNGTLLNGKKLMHVIEVKNNDVVTLGDRLIRINL